MDHIGWFQVETFNSYEIFYYSIFYRKWHLHKIFKPDCVGGAELMPWNVCDLKLASSVHEIW